MGTVTNHLQSLGIIPSVWFLRFLSHFGGPSGRQFWSTFRVFFQVWPRVAFQSGFGVPKVVIWGAFGGLRRRFGVFSIGFGAMLKNRDSSSIIVNDFVKLRIDSST